jgi:multiple antibiotic resistance protein
MDLFIYLFVALFSVLNPIGTVPFVGLTQNDTKKEFLSLWTAINVFILILSPLWTIRPFFRNQHWCIAYWCGIIKAVFYFQGIYQKRGINKKAETDAQQRNDIALTPLAIPMLAGPINLITNRILSRTQHDNGNYYFLDCDSLPLLLFIILKCSLSR